MSDTSTLELSLPTAARTRQSKSGELGLLLWLLPLHALVWTLGAWLASSNLDTPGDMIENYAWGIEWQAGYAKHPPLFAWITAAWFRVFPHTDIAYFALSSLNAMAGLFGIVALAGRFVPRRLALLAGVAMAVSPLYSNLAIKFNANSVLLSIWPWAAYFFVRYMQTRGWVSALALGALAAAAVLGKYFSIVLLLALAFATLARPDWRARLIDWRTLLVAAAFAAVLAPHVHWLVVNHFPTFAYADKRTGGTFAAAIGRFGIYTLAQIGYLALSFVALLLMVRKRRGEAAKLMAASIVKPSMCPDLWWLTLAPLFAVGLIACAARTQMASVWGMAQWFAVAPLWLTVLHRAGIRLEPARAVRVLGGYWLIVLAATTTVGYLGARHNSDAAAEPRAELAAAAQDMWKERFGSDVPSVAGSVHEAQSVAFYSHGHTQFWSMGEPQTTPWLQLGELDRHGALFVCRANDVPCIVQARWITGEQPDPVTVHKHAWGRELAARQYVFFVVAPDR
ncbi:glycosyltransferase family 39 protein [Paraburkholderia sp. Ac-20340]|uniref:glycosyltransferase family 39 protein n=1 Tax=Paraburkholderia sp. Ac-20340 TaxID=2703888 RepID=UPI0019817304|nr:glycosyltransferase family 39 protein [Paraburkholderia sp. Ac-20340]MBN3858767.1 glycosyltransferase family 39 protein [Paraburkholderia sp. Ac-20340]